MNELIIFDVLRDAEGRPVVREPKDMEWFLCPRKCGDLTGPLMYEASSEIPMCRDSKSRILRRVWVEELAVRLAAAIMSDENQSTYQFFGDEFSYSRVSEAIQGSILAALRGKEKP